MSLQFNGVNPKDSLKKFATLLTDILEKHSKASYSDRLSISEAFMKSLEVMLVGALMEQDPDKRLSLNQIVSQQKKLVGYLSRRLSEVGYSLLEGCELELSAFQYATNLGFIKIKVNNYSLWVTFSYYTVKHDFVEYTGERFRVLFLGGGVTTLSSNARDDYHHGSTATKWDEYLATAGNQGTPATDFFSQFFGSAGSGFDQDRHNFAPSPIFIQSEAEKELFAFPDIHTIKEERADFVGWYVDLYPFLRIRYTSVHQSGLVESIHDYIEVNDQYIGSVRYNTGPLA